MRPRTLRSLVALALAAAAAPAASALDVTVDSAVDAPDLSPGDGLCAAIVGRDPSCFPVPCFTIRCTLRAAVQETNAWPGADTIQVPAGRFVLTRAGWGEGAAETGDLDIADSVVVQGAGAGATVIDAAGLDRVFDVHPAGDGWLVELAGMTVRGGSEGLGAGVAATSADRGRLRIRDSVIEHNRADFWGGGVLLGTPAMQAEILRTTLRDNVAELMGGGLLVSGHGGTALIASTVSGNTSEHSHCAGIMVWDGSLSVRNSTLSGNEGGLCTVTGGATGALNVVDLWQVTVAENTQYGLAATESPPGSWALRETIVANPSAPDCVGLPIVAGDYNLDGDGSCRLGAPNDLSGVDPRLGPLAPNGGPTLTHALLSGSPALDSGPPAGPNDCFGTDQRGIVRRPACDRGAYEKVRSGCGLGAELALAIPLLALGKRRRSVGRR